MKKTLKILACVLLAGMLAFGTLCVYAAYSSEDDPLISLSYINEVLLPQIQDMIEKRLAGEDIGDITATEPAETTVVPETTEAPETTEVPVTTTVPVETTAPVPETTFPAGTVNTGSKFAVIQLQEGETLFASVNACEVIVRSGQTKVVSPFTVKWEEQGIPDTTDGKEIYNDEVVPNNHTILIPRDDGRGIVCGAGGAWLMVRGDYIVKGIEPAETTEPVVTTAEPVVTTVEPVETTAEPVETTGAEA